MSNNDVEELLVTVLMILAQMECPGRVRIGHEGDSYIVDIMVEEDGELASSMEVGTGKTLAQALRSLLSRMEDAESNAYVN